MKSASIYLFLGVLGPLIVALPLWGAVKVSDCLDCHGDYKNYKHGSVSCTDCHTDIAELPHKEKLKRPVCQSCHNESHAVFLKSVHGKKGMQCKDCHAVHDVTKERKYCASCHPGVTHKSLPAREKHLTELQCTSCHSMVSGSGIDIAITIPPGIKTKKENFDRNSDGRIDAKEWSFVEAYLEQNFKGHYRVTKRFTAKTDVHAVASKSVSCDQCHVDRKVFGRAQLVKIGTVPYGLAIDAALFVPEIPSIPRYRETIHGKKRVRCADCHVGQEKVSDAVCTSCHPELFTLYKHTPHGTKNAALCTDCHNPHEIKGYKQLNIQERVAKCARCHKDYVRKHLWLPNTALHFAYLECTTCHSPDSQKSMIFGFARKTPRGELPLAYDDMRHLAPAGTDVRGLIDRNSDNIVSSQELADLFLNLRQKLGKDVHIDGSILVTKVYHNFTVTRHHEKECTACHSKDAPFYDSMYIVLPGADGNVYIPAKDTVLSALPLATAINMTLLGEEKIRPDDIRKLFKASGEERLAFVRELGLRWIDFAGLSLALLLVAGVAVHAVLRKVTKR
ncbi:MAG: cytochrome c family protein [Deltaproteobacteria bacterium]|nr:cytochrome c family protein [Deltaproteobacteria bacterium]